MEWHVFGLTIHAYGLIVGGALAVVWELVRHKAKKYRFPEKTLEHSAVVGVIGGLIGARLWHVATDWSLYKTMWWNIFYVWEGGLSILGAIVGGGGAVALFFNFVSPTDTWRKQFWWWADLMVFGLPFGQALGRVANFVNQELYGLPTTLPWGIFIDAAHRVKGYEQMTFFHPLFAYEMIGTLVFGVGLWWWDHQSRFAQIKHYVIGTGVLAEIYLWYYAGLRFILDFLRIDKAQIGLGGLGINQVLLLGVFIILSVRLSHRFKNYEAKFKN